MVAGGRGGCSYIRTGTHTTVQHFSGHGYHFPLLSTHSNKMSAIWRERLEELNLTREELLRYKRLFQAFDRNGNGIVELREFVQLSQSRGYKLSKEEILEIFGRTNLDEGCSVGFYEFVVAMHSRKQKAKEWAPYREPFMVYDTQKKGYITSDEIYPVLNKELGFDLNKTESLIDMYDKNRDYRISLQEFIPLFNKVEELKQQVWKAFNMFDVDGDGLISYEEATQIMQDRGFTPAEIDEAFRKYDTNGDGQWDMSEFAAFWNIAIF